MSQKLLNEVSAARVALLNPEKKAEYDAQLKETLRAELEAPLGPSTDQLGIETSLPAPSGFATDSKPTAVAPSVKTKPSITKQRSWMLPMGISIAAILVLGVVVVVVLLSDSKEDDPDNSIAEQPSKQQADKSPSDQVSDNKKQKTGSNISAQHGSDETRNGGSSIVELIGRQDNSVDNLENISPTVASPPAGDAHLQSSSHTSEPVVAHHKLEGHSAEITALAYSPDGTRVATAAKDETIRIWDLSSHKESTLIQTRDSHVASIVFSPSGESIACGFFRPLCVNVYDVESGELRKHLPLSHRAASVAFTPDGLWLFACGAWGPGKDVGGMTRWDAGAWSASSIKTGSVFGGTISPNGSRGIVCLPREYLISQWSFDTKKMTLRLWTTKERPGDLYLSTDSGLVAVSCEPNSREKSPSSVYVWNLMPGDRTEVAHLKLPGACGVWSVRFSPGRKYIAAGSNKGVFIWELNTKLLVRACRESTVSVASCRVL